MRFTLPWCLIALACAVTPGAWAQGPCATYLKFPAVGRWAEYEGTYNTKDSMTTRYAVVGSETRAGTEYKWIELKLTDRTKARDMVYQMLVPGGPLEMGQVQEVIMKPGSERAMKMSGMMLNMVRGQLEKNSFFKDTCTEVTLVGQERVTVPAGSYQAKHFRSDKYETDSWLDPAVPFSLVKSSGKKHEMVLVATGTGAKSSITEVPQEMGPPGQ
jgi:hypothetical protein